MKKIVLAGLLILQGHAFAEDTVIAEASIPVEESPAWLSSGRLSLGGRVLEEYEEYATGIMMPVWMPDRGAVFLDLRGSFLEDLEQELNAGVVARRISAGRGIILGANAYFDTRVTDTDQRYDQVAGGIEILSDWVDVRANYYYPTTDETILDEAEETSSVRVGRRITSTRTLYRSYEEALDGYDAEIGLWIPWISRHIPTALYGGYYQFNSDLVDDEKYGGMKARLEMRVLPNLTVSGEWFEEAALNQSEYIGSLMVQIPLDFWRKANLPGSGGPYMPLESRMHDAVQRDLRVRVIKTGPLAFDATASQTTIRPDVVCQDVFVTDPVTGTITVITVCK